MFLMQRVWHVADQSLELEMKLKLLVAAAAMCLSQAASAAVIVNTWEQGGGVNVAYTGTLDTTGYSFVTTNILDSFVVPSVDLLANVPGPLAYTNNAFTDVTGSAGTGDTFTATSAFGANFAFSSLQGGELAMSDGYVSGDLISGGMTFAGQTLASMRLNVGDVVFTLTTGDTITWAIGSAPAPVPLPAGLPLVIGGLGALALLGRRRKR